MPSCQNDKCGRDVRSLDAVCEFCGMDNHWYVMTGSAVFYDKSGSRSRKGVKNEQQ